MKKYLLLVIKLLICLPVLSAYKQEKIRYLSSADLVTTLSINFPGFKNHSQTMSTRCSSIRNSNRDSLGVMSPSLGRPLIAEPNPAFVRWFNHCLSEYMNREFSREAIMRPRIEESYFPDSLIQELKLANHQELRKVLDRPWKSFSEDQQRIIVGKNILKLIGPIEALRVKGFDGGMNELTSIILASVEAMKQEDSTMENALLNINLAIMLRDEFLRY